MTSTGRAKIWDHGIRIYGPKGARKDGEWSRKEHVEAVFLNPVHARKFLRERISEGYPAYVSNEDQERLDKLDEEES